MGWPADKQAETNINFMQYGSDPPLDKQKSSGRFDTELPLRPISSCKQHHSCCRCRQWSIAPSPVPAPSRFPEQSHRSERPLPFTPCRLLLDIFQIPQPASYCHVNFKGPAYSFNHKREHSQAARLSLVKPGQRQLSLSKTGETENQPICCKES